MKKSIFAKVGAAAMVLTLVTASLVGGTFAKYATKVDATANATVAKWDVKFTDGQNDITKDTVFTLTPTDTTGKAANTIIPGDAGKFDVVVNGKDAQVTFDYSIKVKNADGTTLNVEFFADDKYATPITTLAPKKGTIKFDAVEADKTVTVPVYWKLAKSTNAIEDTANDEDTKLAGQTGSYIVTLEAVQNTDGATN